MHVTLDRIDKLESRLREQVPEPAHGDGWKIAYGNNKTKLMPKILEHLTPDDLTDQLDLSKKLDELVKFIEKANSPTAAVERQQ